MTVVVNMFGAPSSGKSTTAMGVARALKIAGINAELITEFAKEVVWDDAFKTLDNQIYIFANQHHRIYRCIDKVDVIVTDSPIILGIIYGEQYGQTLSQPFKDLMLYEFNKNDNYNVLLQRKHDYQKVGRVQSEEESNVIATSLKQLLDDSEIKYDNFHAGEAATNRIVHNIFNLLSGK